MERYCETLTKTLLETFKTLLRSIENLINLLETPKPETFDPKLYIPKSTKSQTLKRLSSVAQGACTAQHRRGAQQAVAASKFFPHGSAGVLSLMSLGINIAQKPYIVGSLGPKALRYEDKGGLYRV